MSRGLFCPSFSYEEKRSTMKIRCISEIKINYRFFCISLDLQYLCKQFTNERINGKSNSYR